MDNPWGNASSNEAKPSASIAFEEPEQPAVFEPECEAAIPGMKESVIDQEVIEEVMDQDPLTDQGSTNIQQSFLMEPASESAQVQELLSEKALYERTNFNLSSELSATKEKLVHSSSKLQELQEHVSSSARELNERARMYRQIESSRNDLASKNISLEGDLVKVKQEKEERDSVIRTLNKDKNTLLNDNVAIKNELKSLAGEKASIQIQLQNLEQEKRSLTFERERAKTDRETYESSKRWFIKEMAEKDNKLSGLRIEMGADKLRWQNEKMDITRDFKNLEARVSDLQEMVATKDEAIARCTQSIENYAAEHRQEMDTLETELRNRSELAVMYKESLEKAEACAASLSEQMRARENLVQSTKAVLEEVRQEIDDERSAMRDNLIDRDVQIAKLTEDLDKANNLLRNKHAVSLNVTEEEMANLSPAAAETTRILKGGMTLTQMMREQARLAGELAAERENSAKWETALKEIVEDIETNSPHLLQQKEQLEKLDDECNSLRQQLQSADDQRCNVESGRDGALRELAFTRAELEKYQRDLVMVTKKHNNLMFAMEKERMVRDTDSPPPSDDDDRMLYDSIVSLQKRNSQLESDLAAERASAVHAAVTVQNAELERLRFDLENSKSNENRLVSQLEQLRTAFENLKEQSERLSTLAEENVSGTEARTARLRAEEAVAQAREAELKIVRLEENLIYLREEKAKENRDHQDRVDANQAVVSELMSTKIKLELQFEQQKQIAEVTLKDLEALQRECDRLNKENNKLIAADEQHGKKQEAMYSELMKMQSECSSFKISATLATDELANVKSNLARVQAQLDIYKNNVFRDQQMMGSLNELTTRMSRVEHDRESRQNSQLEVLRMEHDTMKSALARANSQLTQVKNDASSVQTRKDQELSLLGQQLVEKNEQLLLCEQQLVELRTRLATIQSQYAGDDNTDGMTPDRLKKECQQLKNRVQYLDSQCIELTSKLQAAQTEVTRKDTEIQSMLSHGGEMEVGLKQIQRLGDLERERLEIRAKHSEDRASELSNQVAELRTQNNDKDTEMSDLRMKNLQAQNELQQRIDIQNQQLKDAESGLTLINERLANLQQEFERKNNELSETNDNMTTLVNEVMEASSKAQSLETQLTIKEQDLFGAQEAAKLAEERRQGSEAALAERNSRADEAEAAWNVAMAEHDRRLQEILRLYNDIITRFGAENAADLSLLDAEAPLAVIQSQQSVMDYLREEKDKAVERSMSCDVEMKRLRAETREAHSGHDDLVNRIKKLEVEAAVANDALAERAELMRKVESLMTTQQQCQRLRTDKENLQKIAAELQKKTKDLEGEREVLRTQLYDLTIKETTLNSELGARQREAALMQSRLDQATRNQRTAAPLIAELEQTKSKVVGLEAEMEKISTDAKTSEVKINRLREIAKKYRDENNQAKVDMEKQLATIKANEGIIAANKATIERLQAGSLATSGPPLTGNPAMAKLRADIQKLQAENIKLTSDLATKDSDLHANTFRLNLLTSKVSKSETAVAEKMQQIQEKEARINELEKQLTAFGVVPTSSEAVPTVRVESASSVVSCQPFVPEFAAVQPPVNVHDGSVPVSASSPMKTISSSQDASQSSSPMPSKVSFNTPAAQLTAVSSLIPSLPTRPSQSTSNISQNQTPVFGRAPATSVFGTPSAATTMVPSAAQPQPSSTTEKSADNTDADASSDSLSISTAPPLVAAVTPVTVSLASSSRISPAQGKLFGKSAPVTTSGFMSSANSSAEECVSSQRSESATGAGQSSYVSRMPANANVSGSIIAGDDVIDDVQNESAGESRDSTTVNVPVSSTESRKRTATSDDGTEAKRQRESPNEAVTSSEEPQGDELIDDDIDNVAMLEGEADVDNVDEDSQDNIGSGERDEHPAMADDLLEDEEEGDVEDEGLLEQQIFDRAENVQLSDDGESELGDEEYDEVDEDSMDDVDDDDEGEDSFENPERNDDNDVIVVSDSEDDNALALDDAAAAAEEGNDIDDDDIQEVEIDDNSRPSLEDQDREAASAMEEADDEGRGSADQGASAGQPAAASSGGDAQVRMRIPIVYEREDQCSSSNETGSAPPPPPPPARGRQTGRRGRGAMNPRGQIYQVRGPSRGGSSAGSRGGQ